MICAAIFGFGNIGSGVLDVIENNQHEIRKTLPEGLYVKYILDIRDFSGTPYADRVVSDIDIILNDPEIKVVCETMGGKEPAFTFFRKAKEKVISVCTSNKELVEAYGPQLLKIAKENGCSYLFEASVGGGIPLIAPLNNCLRQDRILYIAGILNGTTNYILDRMESEGVDYEPVLKDAMNLGYAERNPEADIEGHDTGRKISILSSLMTGKWVRYENMYVEGISKITQRDFQYASAHGYSVRLLGVSRRDGEALSVMTAPFLLPQVHPLHAARGVFNAVLVNGNKVDNLLFYVRGAGKLPTGSAVVSDMITAATDPTSSHHINWSDEVVIPEPQDECENRFFVKVSAGSREKAEQVFNGQIDEIWSLEEIPDEFAFTTVAMTESDFAKKAAMIEMIGRIRIF